MDKPVTLAAVTGAHGVTGEVRLKLFGEGVDALKRYASFNDGALTLSKIRSDNKGGAVARFAEIADRTAAEQLAHGRCGQRPVLGHRCMVHHRRPTTVREAVARGGPGHASSVPTSPDLERP